MTYYERVDELRDNTNFTAENYEIEYLTAEVVLTDLFGEYLVGAEINSKTYGTGKVVNTSGDLLDRMSMEVTFVDGIKKFGVMPVITGKALFNKFADISEIGDAWDRAFDLHTDMTKKYNELKNAEIQQALEAKKKAEADKKAEERYQNQKAKAIRDFEAQAQSEKTLSAADEFYYSLGWLAKHMGVMTAILPDYLGSAFEKYFGAETPKTLVDGRAKTSGGYAKQWSWEFKCTIKKLKETIVPAYLQDITTDFSKGIHNTSFLWDLVENYGFQFGPKQDIEKIRSHIPSDCLASFEAGLA